jgi:hypothetical protein
LGDCVWIVVADSAYPVLDGVGIETIMTGTGHFEVLEKTLRAIAECKHNRARVFLNSELKLLSETGSAGVTAYRQKVNQLLGDLSICEVDHEEIISKLSKRGRMVRVLIFKSTISIPYTSVHLALNCPDWDPDSEARLRYPKQASRISDLSSLTGRGTGAPRFSGPFSARRNS